ncbi:MAG: lactonase family protein [Pseudomonadota bacterium]
MLQSLWKNVSARRGFKLALAVLTLSAGLAGTCIGAATIAETAQTELVYVGSQGQQIRALRFDVSTGKLAPIGPVAEGLRPTWTVAHPQLPMLYAVNDDNAKEGSVTAFAVDRATGALSKVNEVATGGNGTTHLWLDAPSMTIFAANYGGGSASSIALNGDGSLGALVSTLKAAGSGPHRRQASPHAHGVALDPSGRYALVADLGADRVFVYGFELASHALSPDDAAHPRSFAVPAGSGPRHLAFGANGHFVYLLNELNAEIMTLRWDAQQGHLTLVQSLPTSSPEFAGAKSGAEVAVSRDGRFVYVENRGENTLVVYRVNPASGELYFVQRTSSGGEAPWGLAIHSSGKWMLVAHQRSGKLNVFSIDPASGMLSDTGQSLDSPTPVSVTFVK